MGARKRNTAEKRKGEKKNIAIAKLNNCPTSPRKMRLVADQIRGQEIYNALNSPSYISVACPAVSYPIPPPFIKLPLFESHPLRVGYPP